MSNRLHPRGDERARRGFSDRLSIQRLLEMSARRIHRCPGRACVDALRRDGFLEAMTVAGLVDQATVEYSGMTEECGNDVACVGTLSAADDQDPSVPKNLSLIGCDDTYLARIRHLSLTSVDNGNFAVGSQAAYLLLLWRLEWPGQAQRVVVRSNRTAFTPCVVMY